MFKKGLIALFLLGTTLIALGSGSAQRPNDEVVLKKHNVIVIKGEVNEETMGKAIKDILEADQALSGSFSDKKEPIYVILDTPGGSVTSGLEFLEVAKGIGRPVHTVTFFAASMGFQFAQQLGERHIVSSGTLMSHRARGAVQGEFGGQEPGQLDSRLNFWKTKIREMDEHTVARTNGKQTWESYTKAYVPELWLTGPEAVKGGYADRISKVRCDASLSGTTEHAVMAFGVIPVTFELSNCPLNPNPMNVKIAVKTNKGFMDSETFVKKGGMFGEACMLIEKQDKLCALDSTQTPEKIQEIKKTWVLRYKETSRKVIDYKY